MHRHPCTPGTPTTRPPVAVLVDPYVSVESLVVDGQPFTLGVTGKFPLRPPFREQGQFIPSQLPESEHAAVARLASHAATALGVWRGLVHTEIKLTPGSSAPPGTT